jgi:F0F1-type ATP synthase assembly protein I
VERAAQAADTDKSAGMGLLYIGAAIRFILALVLFGLGLAALDLAPLPLVIGFCMAQAAYVLIMRMQQSSTRKV